MLKKCLFVVLVVAFAGGLIASAGPFASAQANDTAPSNQAPPPDNGASSNGNSSGERHHGFDPAQRTRELTRKLKLTLDQRAKVQDILQSEHAQMESLRADASISQRDRHAKMMAMRTESDTQIRGLLDATQQKKWDEMEARREQGGPRGPRHQGPPDSGAQQTAPPPQ